MILNTLIVGDGSIGNRHFRIIKKNFNDINLKIIPNRFFFMENGHPLKKNLLDLNFSPDVLVLANPAPFHLVETWLGFDKCSAIFIEKPLSINLNNCLNFKDQILGKNLSIQIGYNLRFLPSLIWFKNAVSDKIIGKPFAIRSEAGQFLPTWRPGSEYSKTVSAQKQLGGGALLELSHEIDYIRWIFGEFSWVFSWMGKKSRLAIDVEDMVQVQFGLSSPDYQICGSLQLDFLRHDKARLCTVIGENGTLRWDGILGSVSFFPAGGNSWETLYQQNCDRDESYCQQWTHFFKCFQEKSKPSPGFDDGVEVMRIIEAIRESNETSSKVMIRGLLA